MIAAWRLVIGIVVLNKLRGVIWQRIDNSPGKGIGAVTVILRTLGIELPADSVAGFGIVSGIEITVGSGTAHVIHRRSHCSLDAGIHGGGIDGHSTPATDAEDTDAFRINVFACRQIINRSAISGEAT